MKIPLSEAIIRNNIRKKFAKETDEELKIRYSENSDAIFLSEEISFIDATPPFEEVLKKVMLEIWHNTIWD